MFRPAFFIEALRRRPGLWVLAAASLSAMLWTAVALLLFAAPLQQLALRLVLAPFGQIDADAGGLLAAGLAYSAFRLGGLAGVYCLFGLAFIAASLLAYRLAWRLFGAQMGGAAALVFLAMLAVGGGGLPFALDRLALPALLWLMWEAWRLIGEGDERAWPPLAAAAGLALFAGWAGWASLATVAVLLATTPQGRAALHSPFLVRPIAVFATFLVPFAAWVVYGPPGWAALRGFAPLSLAGFVAGIAVAAVPALALWAAARLPSEDEDPQALPVLVRGPLPAPALGFLLMNLWPLALLLVPAAFGASLSVWSVGAPTAAALWLVARRGERLALYRSRVVGQIGAAFLLAPPIIAALVLALAPVVGRPGADVNFPAGAVAVPMSEIAARRMGHAVRILAGEFALAAPLALASPAQPAVMPDADPSRAPWIAPGQPARDGLVLVWTIRDPAGEPPAAMRTRWPGLRREAPIVVPWSIAGRLEPVRIGWAIVPPVAVAAP
ncbi:MAG TPA: hypothetical protein VLA00_09970 [Xanthobacteraceae bacterium]|nr:hypothetical protein [Xanthobacteraceae bacterium]